MFGTRFITLGASPAFFTRLRTWFRQTFIVDFQVAEILAAPVPVLAKDAEVKLVNVPKPCTTSAARAAHAEATTSPSGGAGPPWVEKMGPLTLSALRRQIRRRKGWHDLRRRHQMQASREESTGLLAAVAEGAS